MAHNSHKKQRTYVSRPGVKAAAKLLSCSYTHLRRVVAGKRHNPGLLELYKQLAPPANKPGRVQTSGGEQ